MLKEGVEKRFFLSILDIEILKYLTESKKEVSNLSEVCKGIKGNIGNVNPHLEHLKNCGLITSEQNKKRPYIYKISIAENKTGEINILLNIYKRLLKSEKLKL